MSSKSQDLKAIANTVFEQIQADFPDLEMELTKPDEHFDLELNIPAQHGLDFWIGLNLQGDELHLCASGFWVEWFPCTEESVVEEFVAAVYGLINGTYRLKVVRRGQSVVKSTLQRKGENGWNAVTGYSCLHIPWFRKKSIRYFRNRHSEDHD